MSAPAAQLVRLVGGDPDALADPYPIWSQLREAAPAHRIGRRVFVTRYDDVKRLCQDASDRYGLRAADCAAVLKRASKLSPEEAHAYRELWRFVGLWMVGKAGEDHARLRRIAHRAFSAQRIAALAASTREHVDQLLGPLGPAFDMMPLAYELPLRVITELLGCPREDEQQIAAWSIAIAAALDTAPPEVAVRAHMALHAFTVYVEHRVQESRREAERTDLVIELLDARDGDHLSEDELVAMFVLLLFAGHETSAILIGHGLHQLLSHRDQWQVLCAQPELWPNAIEELLRFVSPVQYIMRPVGESHTLADVSLDVGDVVIPVLASANRDPRVFASPDALDVTRAHAKRHLALGFGAKFCLGAALARMTAGTMLSELARRFPQLRLVPGELCYTSAATLRRLESLFVTR